MIISDSDTSFFENKPPELKKSLGNKRKATILPTTACIDNAQFTVCKPIQ